MASDTLRQFFRDNPRMWAVVTIAAVISITIALILFSGASLEIGKFFAAEPAHTASILTVQCGMTQNVLTWTLPTGHDSNTVLRNVDGANGVAVFSDTGNVVTYTDTNIQPGHTYVYRHKAFADAVSNSVTCSPGTATPSPSLQPTPTSSPTPTEQSPAALLCAPDSQTTSVGRIVRVQAIGGTDSYTWTSNGGGVQQGIGEDFVDFSYIAPGTKLVAVSSVAEAISCQIIVQAESSPAPTASSSQLVLMKQARNITIGQQEFQNAVTVQSRDTVQFSISIKSSFADPVSLNVADVIPSGMSYVAGRTLVNGQPTSDDEITAGGIAIAALNPGQLLEIRWVGIADQTDTIVSGANQFHPRARVVINGTTQVTGEMNVSIFGDGISQPTSGTGNPGQVNTGPGDVVMMALMVASMLTLLYTAYTRSGAFRRHEARVISRDQGPMDFRN